MSTKRGRRPAINFTLDASQFKSIRNAALFDILIGDTLVQQGGYVFHEQRNRETQIPSAIDRVDQLIRRCEMWIRYFAIFSRRNARLGIFACEKIARRKPAERNGTRTVS